MTSTSDHEMALRELGRFFQLARQLQERGLPSPQMPISYIDAVWHQLQGRTEDYRKFAIQVTGYEVSHLIGTGEGDLTWIPAYEALFGQLPSIWFIGSGGVFAEREYEQYRRTGVWKAAWDCNPYVNLREVH